MIKKQINNKNTNVVTDFLGKPSTATIVSFIAILLSSWVYIDSTQPKDTKLTIKTDYRRCFSGGIECSQLFIYNNDEAPCFDLRIKFDANQYKDVIYLKDYAKSSLLNAKDLPNDTYAIPEMAPKLLKANNSLDQGWIGFIPNKVPLYIAFIPYDPYKKQHITLECADYKQDIDLKSK